VISANALSGSGGLFCAEISVDELCGFAGIADRIEQHGGPFTISPEANTPSMLLIIMLLTTIPPTRWWTARSGRRDAAGDGIEAQGGHDPVRFDVVFRARNGLKGTPAVHFGSRWLSAEQFNSGDRSRANIATGAERNSNLAPSSTASWKECLLQGISVASRR